MRRFRLVETLRACLGLRLIQYADDAELECSLYGALGRLGVISPKSYVAEVLCSSVGQEAGPVPCLLRAALVSPYTLFFRDEAQLRAVCQVLATHPERHRRPLRVWSAGCSTGEEPYSIAILCAEYGLDVSILATDVHPRVLQEARRGIYREETLRHVSPSRRRYFVVDGAQVRLCEEIRRRVTFVEHDFLAEQGNDGVGAGWDVIVCRNALMYYRSEVTARAVVSLGERLVSGGWLFIGATDHLGTSVRAPLSRVLVEGWAAFQRDAKTRGFEVLPSSTHSGPVYKKDNLRLDEPPRPLDVSCEDALALCNQAGHQIAEHAFVAAVGTLNRAVVAAPLLPDVHYLFAMVQKKQSRHRDAVECLRRTLFWEPTFWPALVQLAGLWRRLGEQDRARAQLLYALQLIDERPRSPFRSCVDGIPGIACSADEARRLCHEQLRP